MNWDDIKVFLSVAEAGSLRSAASRLKVSQPTIGRRLAALEAESGSGPLFERTPQGHAATSRGAALLPAARALAEAALAFERQVAGLTDAIAGTIRVAAYEWPRHYVAARSQVFREELPGITLELGEMRSGGADLARRDADLGVFEGPLSLHDSDGAMIIRRLGALNYGIYAAPSLLRDGDAAYDPAARFTDCPWIACDDVAVAAGGGEASRAPHRWLEQRVAPEAARFRCAGASMQITAARAGAGLVVLPRLIGDAESGLIRVADDLDGEPPVELWIGVHRDLRRSRCVGAVMDLLITVFEETRAG